MQFDSALPTIVILAEAAGGVMRHVIDLYTGLSQRGFSVRLILSPTRIDERYKEELNALDQRDLTYIPMRRGPHRSDLAALAKIRYALTQIDGPVLLHAHSTKAGLLGVFLRARIATSVFTPHAYRGMDPTLRGISKRIIGYVERFYSRTYRRIIAVAPLERDYARALGIRPESIEMIPNGIHLEGIDFKALKRRRSERSIPPVLGFVGRLVHQKNPLLFIETMHELDKRGGNFTAIIVGDGPLRSRMEELAAKHGLLGRIEWKGEVASAPFYPLMSVMLHTSRYEALPYSLIEACAALLPIVAIENPGSVAVLSHHLPGSLVTQPDPGELAEKITALFRDDHLYNDQLSHLEEIAREFSTEKMIQCNEQVYREVMAERQTQ